MQHSRVRTILTAILTIALSIFVPPLMAQTPKVREIKPTISTEPVGNDADDPAIWLNPQDPSRSLIIATNKTAAAEGGALYVYDTQGKIKQVLGQIDRPNNVDVEYGFKINGIPIDIAVTTERNTSRLRVFYIRPDGSGLKEIGKGCPVLEGETPQSFASPMGIALYKRPKDGAIFAIISRKAGPTDNYLWQYRLVDNGNGGIVGKLIRKFGKFSGKGEIEAVAVDDALGYVYYADEGFGFHKYHADPEHPNAAKELCVFGKNGYKGDREGIAIYARPDGTGYIICADQLVSNSLFYIYRREGEPGKPHDHSRLVAVIKGGADETDGIDVTAASLGKDFPKGLLIAMNSGKKNFLMFDLRRLGIPL